MLIAAQSGDKFANEQRSRKVHDVSWCEKKNSFNCTLGGVENCYKQNVYDHTELEKVFQSKRRIWWKVDICNALFPFCCVAHMSNWPSDMINMRPQVLVQRSLIIDCCCQNNCGNLQFSKSSLLVIRAYY